MLIIKVYFPKWVRVDFFPLDRHILWCKCTQGKLNSDIYCTNLFVVFDLIVKDDTVGSFWFLPGQGDTASSCLLLFDHCYWRGSWAGDTDSQRVSSVSVRFSGSSVHSVESWQLSIVPVSLIQFAAWWGGILRQRPRVVSGTRQCKVMYKKLHWIYISEFSKCVSIFVILSKD